MRTLIALIKKYSDFLLFLLLEIAAVILLFRGTYYQQSKISGLTREISGFLYEKTGNVREYLSLKQVNEDLVLENRKLRNTIEFMSRMIDTSYVSRHSEDETVYFYLPAGVVRNSVFRQYNYLTIDKGKKDGVFRDMGVISDRGLVGIVLESSNHFATVIPIINRDFRLSAKIKSNNYAGILQWEGSSPLSATLREIPYHVELSKGDTVVTSGFSAIFPEGIPVGVIEDFSLDRGNFYDISITLATSFQNLFHVNVIRNYYREEQINLEEEFIR
jgi:rod shape-determining protein MreC